MRVILIAHFPADDLAAVEVQDQVDIEPADGNLGRQIGHVPAQDLARCAGQMRALAPTGLRRLGADQAGVLASRAKDAVEGRFAGDIAG